MECNVSLHHVALRITTNSLEKVIEVFELLECNMTYRKGDARWAMVGQHTVPIDVQFLEVDEAPLRSTSRTSSHVAFVSATPLDQIQKVEGWARENDIRFEKGGWSEKELWFDLPDLFVDFVVEIMHTSIAEG